MKRIIKIVFCLIMIFVVSLSAFALQTNAATLDDIAATKMQFVPSKSGNKYNVGDTVTVNVQWSPSAPIIELNGEVTYNSSVLQYISGADSNPAPGEARLYRKLSDSGETSVSFSFQFKVIAEGNSNIAVSLSAGDLNLDKHIGGQTGTLFAIEAVTPPDTSSTPSDTSSTTPSSNANLASLKVSGGTLSPKFNANTTNYTVTVDNDVEKTTVSATSADKDAKINGTGNVKLSVGDNKRVITVTATDGTKKVYNITIRRLAEGEEAETDGEEDNDNTVSSDPYGVMIDGELYRIESELSDENAPIGYTKTEIAYNGTVVPVYTDAASKMMLYSIKKDGAENADFYIYDVTDKKFKKIEYLQTADRFYLFAEMEENISAPAGFFEKNIEIGDVQIKGFVYKNSLLSDFAVVYCYAEGKYGYYRYDKKENTLQRLPEFTPVVSQKVNSNINQSKPESKGLLDKFSSFKTEAKLVIIAIIVAAISVIGLIILFIIYLFKHRDDDVKEGAFTTADYSYEVEDAQPFNNVENGVEPENNNDNTKK